MSELAKTENRELVNWDDEATVKEIRKIFAPKLDDIEFKAFMGMAKATNLNPFLREIWAVKYNSKEAAQIFIGRDGYRKAAQESPEYDYHHVDAVYENDTFRAVNGEAHHEYEAANRGKLLGAYCMVKRKSSSRASYVYVELGEYDAQQSIWKTKKATMIKKVAEAQALRAAFQGIFGGTYSDAEEASMHKKQSKTSRDKEAEKEMRDVIQGDNDAVKHMISDDVLLHIQEVLLEKKVAKDTVGKALDYYGVCGFEELTEQQGQHFIDRMNTRKS